jgi:hypothetical protein
MVCVLQFILLKFYMHFSSLPCIQHAFSSHPPWFDHPDDVSKEYKLLNSSFCNFLQSPFTLPFRSKDSPQNLVFRDPKIYLFLNVTDHLPHPYETTDQNLKSFIFWDITACSLVKVNHYFRVEEWTKQETSIKQVARRVNHVQKGHNLQARREFVGQQVCSYWLSMANRANQ